MCAVASGPLCFCAGVLLFDDPDRPWWRSLPECTMQACGNACGTSFSWTSTNDPTCCRRIHTPIVSRSNAWRSRVAAHWASWADCLPMIHARHPDVAAQRLGHLEGHPETPCLLEAAATVRSLDGGNTKPRHVVNGPTERRSFSLECQTQQKLW